VAASCSRYVIGDEDVSSDLHRSVSCGLGHLNLLVDEWKKGGSSVVSWFPDARTDLVHLLS
jgi:hypothetical protein